MKKPELVSAYFLCHGHSTVIPDQLKENFEDMADCGFNAVCITISENEMAYGRRAVDIQVRLAHEAGLKVFVIPSRVGGRFAGAPLAPSLWLAQHPEAQVPGFTFFLGALACLEHQPFRDWLKAFMGTIITDYPIDGIIWDEPKEERRISRHPDTLAKFGPNPTERQMEEGYVDFLTDVTSHCLSLNKNLIVTVFNQKPSSEFFTQATVAIPGIRYGGYDGNLARQSFFHEPAGWRKYRIESVWERTQSECAKAGKKTFALVENMMMPSIATPEYEANFESYLQNYRPDHLAIYYYSHNNEDPNKVQQITKRLMKQYL